MTQIYPTSDGWYWEVVGQTEPTGPYENQTQAVISLLAYLHNMEVNCG